MKKKCEKSLDGKHLFEERIITSLEGHGDYGKTLMLPIYADYCIKCNNWGKVHNPNFNQSPTK